MRKPPEDPVPSERFELSIDEGAGEGEVEEEDPEEAAQREKAIWDHMARRLERFGQKERRVQRRHMVAELITRHKNIRSQTEIQQLLEKRGMFATQSSISRDLRDLGVQRVKGVYVLKPAREASWSFDDVLELVDLISRSGPYTTVIQTLPGAGRLVARSLEEPGWDEVVGTVSDESTVFVAHRGKEGQDQFFERLRPYMKE